MPRDPAKRSARRRPARYYIRSSSFSMALLFTALLSLSAGSLGYFSYYFTQGRFVAAAENAIDTENIYLALAEKQDALAATLREVDAQEGHVYLYWDGAGSKLGGNLAALPRAATTLAEGTILFDMRGRIYAAKIITFPDGRRLLTGTDVTHSAHSYKLLQWLSVLSIFFTALVVLVSFAISTFVVSRTNRISDTAREIMATGDLSRRIAIDAHWDDLSNAAYVLNELLARMETLMQGMRTVTDNVAHDLRTPLTRLLNGLEALRGRPAVAGDDDMRAECDAMIAEALRLLSTFNALLRIGAVESGSQRAHFTAVDLHGIVADVVEFYEPLAEANGMTLAADLSETPALRGDRDLLFQAAANLLDNALKFTPAGGRVRVTLRDEGGPVLRVEDSGPGLPPAERTRAFDRFFRAEASRTTPGNGLGLALVAAVAALHGGAVALEDGPDGTGLRAVLRLGA